MSFNSAGFPARSRDSRPLRRAMEGEPGISPSESPNSPNAPPVSGSPRSTLSWQDDSGPCKPQNVSTATTVDSNSLPRSLSLESRSPKTPPLRLVLHHGARGPSIPDSPTPPVPPVTEKPVEFDGDGETGCGPAEDESASIGSTAARPHCSLSPASSSVNDSPSAHESAEEEGEDEDEDEDAWSAASTPAAGSPAASAGDGGGQELRRMHFFDLSEELASLKSCAKRALELGKQAQLCATAEVAQLRVEQAAAAVAARRLVELNHALKQQVLALRDENQRLQTERQLEMLAMLHDRETLEREREGLAVAVLDEKRGRERAQRAASAERENFERGLREERERAAAVREERDAAREALQDGTLKLEAEREAMLDAMRDLTAKLDIERDAKLRSLRRSSMDMCVANMNTAEKKLTWRRSMLKDSGAILCSMSPN